jgi:Domain of unknown function (DUF4129)
MTEGRATVPARRALGWGALALALVAVVAMAAHGAAWSTQDHAEARSLPHGVVVAGGIAAGVVAAILFIAMLATTRASETPEQRRRRWTTAIAFLVVIAVLSIVRVVLFRHDPHSPRTPAPSSQDDRSSSPSDRGPTRPADTTWWPVVLVGLGAAAIFVSAVTRRSRLALDAPPDLDPTLRLLDASIDDLRSEPDARRAVVAAYARMERGLAASGFARLASETPTEYLRRALGARASEDRPIAIEPLRELTTLAERARFSVAPIDEAMRERAIAALQQIRADLRAPESMFGVVS